ncbi:nitrate reductase [Aliikangiella marina]|uniref:Nitrate reductase n=1 Tax=Aliikangiella marina TaxID=1712262 RepID=A0A545TI17_9GAMM|nr:nitrate reductase [Aliikangiella marina]TQV76852.1 nitrate reductase [Aliikangiella marina]
MKPNYIPSQTTLTGQKNATEHKNCIGQTTCAYCGVGCGVDIHFEKGEPVAIEGTPSHPANYGKLCVKGNHLLETLTSEDRLITPQIDGKSVSWHLATDMIADRLIETIRSHGPDSVAFYLSGQLLTEDYYVANKFMKGYVGSANVDTNSRLCMSSAVAAYIRAFGEDIVPCSYSDLEQTDLLIIIGSNAAWTHPVLYQRIERAKQINPAMQIVLIDPRRTATVEIADKHLALKPGTDAAIYNGLLNYLANYDGLDKCFIEKHTENFDGCLAEAKQWSVNRVASFCELKVQEIESLYDLFLCSPRVISFYSMGINQSSSGTDKCQSIINAHLASGKLLRPGCGPFSITGQPNAMGGREVGGMSNMLTSHMDIENATHREQVKTFWQSPTIASKAGLKAVDMFEQMRSGQIKAVWIMATNPMVSLPNRPIITEALKACETVIVSDCVARNDTLEYANVVLPVSGWLEKDGTVTNSERVISRQRGLIGPNGEVKHDWQIICEVAKKMGFDGFDYQHVHEIFNEWTALTGYKNNGSRQLDLSAIGRLSQSEYNNLKPQQWPIKPGGDSRVFVDRQFSTSSGRAHFHPVTPRLPIQTTSEQFPIVMNSGRLRDHWHTMTRTGRSARLHAHTEHPYIEINPSMARTLDIVDGDLIRAQSSTGEVIANARVTDSVRKGQCFMPIHWSKQYASHAKVSALYQSVIDPISGQPESKHTAVRIEKMNYAQHGFLFLTSDINLTVDYWSKTRISKGWLWHFAMHQEGLELRHFLQEQLTDRYQWLQFNSSHLQSVVAQSSGELKAVGYLSNVPVKINSDWLNQLSISDSISDDQLNRLLHAQTDPTFENGKQVCSCFKVYEKSIVTAIKEGHRSVAELGKKLQCGTNCGSCKTELSQLIKTHAEDTHHDIHALVL